MRTKLALLLLCCATYAHAQDTYWPLDGNRIYNTASNTVTNTSQVLTPFSGYSFFDDWPVIFNSSAELLFTRISPFAPNTSNFGLNDIGQILTIPYECRKYLSVELGEISTPHGHFLDVSQIDASSVTNNINTTGLPSVTGSTTLWAAASSGWYGAVAAKLNSNGTRYLYHLNYIDGPGVVYADLSRYEIDASGNVNTTPVIMNNTLPRGNYLDISPDGKSVAYFNDNGQFVTYELATSTLTTYSSFTVPASYPYVIPTTECVIMSGGQRRWFVGDDAEMCYFTEGSSGSYVKASSTSQGANSSIALGRDGYLYYAYNSSGVNAGAGQLYKFDPASVSSGNLNGISSLVSGSAGNATISTKVTGPNYTPSYYFGNQVAGEDVNSATAPTIPPSFTLNNATSGNNILICDKQGPVSLILLAQQFGVNAGYTVKVEEGQYTNGTFVLTGNTYDLSQDVATADVSLDLFALFSDLSQYGGWIKITFSTISPCGETLSTTAVFNLIHAKAVVDFYMIGPQDINSSPVCNYLGVSLIGLQNPVLDHSLDTPPGPTGWATVMANRPSPSQQLTPVCSEGWLGASSVGISKGVLTINNTQVKSIPLPYHLVVNEYNSTTPTPGFIKKVLDKQFSTIPASSYPFFNKTSPLFYFTTNYNTIRDNYFYEVTLTVETDCGPYSKSAYFKILNGGDDGIAFKQTPTDIINMQNSVQAEVYPNPAVDMVHAVWTSAGNEHATLLLINAMGQKVLQQNFESLKGSNQQTVNISHLAPGLYHYTLQTESGSYTGKLVKQ